MISGIIGVGCVNVGTFCWMMPRSSPITPPPVFPLTFFLAVGTIIPEAPAIGAFDITAMRERLGAASTVDRPGYTLRGLLPRGRGLGLFPRDRNGNDLGITFPRPRNGGLGPLNPRSRGSGLGLGFGALLLRGRGGRGARCGHAASHAKFVPGSYTVPARAAPPRLRAAGALSCGRLDAYLRHDTGNRKLTDKHSRVTTAKVGLGRTQPGSRSMVRQVGCPSGGPPRSAPHAERERD